MADVRARVWLFVFYPDSAPEDWESVIDGWGCTCYVSPLHCLDKTAQGGIKKPHYHGIVSFEGNKSYGQVLSLASELGCSIVKVCNSFKNSLRYLCHLDHPDKAQYDLHDVKFFGHADLSALYERTDSEINADVSDLLVLIRQLGLCEFSDLVDYVVDNIYDTHFESLRKNYDFLRCYMQNRVFKAHKSCV